MTARGTRVFVLPRGIKDRKGFFDGVRSVLPLDPPVLTDRSWDALADSMWSGLDALDEASIALIWPGARETADAAPDVFEVAKDVLSDVAESLGDHEATVGKSKAVLVILT